MKNIAVALVLFTASVATAQTPVDLSGHWKGTIEIPNTPMDFELDVAKDARGQFVGTATAGTDRVTLPLLTISVDGKALAFYARTDQPFRGEISDSGKSIAGTATLSGYALPFSMGRTGDAKIDPPPTSPAVSKELEGTWTGMLSAAGSDFHFVTTITNQPGGTALAEQVSVDEGGLRMYLVVAQNGRSVRIDAPALSTSFTGELNAAGIEISGTWTQRQTTLPLTMVRATGEGKR